MQYLKGIFKFTAKFYVLAIPLYIVYVISGLSNKITVQAILNDLLSLSGYIYPVLHIPRISKAIASSIFFLACGGTLSLILKLAVIPATYGMVNKALDHGSSSLKDFIPSLFTNFRKYIFYLIGVFLTWFTYFWASVFFVFVFALMLFLPAKLSIGLVVCAIIACAIAGILLAIYISLWFSAMIVDGLGSEEALRKSYKLVQKSFWTISSVEVFITVGGMLLRSVLETIVFIPYIKPVIAAIAPALSNFLLIVFCLMFYRDRQKNEIQWLQK